MSRKYLQELIKNLQEFYKCPSCETNYHFDDIKYLGQIDQYCFVQLSCHACSMPVLATVSVGGKDIKSKPAATQPTEHSKFTGRGAITSVEIAEFHRFITTERDPIARLSSK